MPKQIQLKFLTADAPYVTTDEPTGAFVTTCDQCGWSNVATSPAMARSRGLFHQQVDCQGGLYPDPTTQQDA